MRWFWGITAWATGAFLLLAACEFGSETENERTGGQIFNPDGKPAKGANVQFYAVDYLPTEAGEIGLEFETKTDKDGWYEVPNLEKGRYNIISSLNGNSAKLDSVFIDKNVENAPPDTLGEPGAYIGYVKLQPNHDPRSVVVQVLGTQFYSNVDKEGQFKFENMPKGVYKVKLSTNIAEYTELFETFNVHEGKTIRNPEPWELTYTGIPIVQNIKVNYDTAKAIVSLSWDEAEYQSFKEYSVYREIKSNLDNNLELIALTTSVNWADTIFQEENLSGVADNFKSTIEYYVVVKAKNLKEGEFFNSVLVEVVSPNLAEEK